MKVLLDENIDVRFKKAFEGSEHEVFTVRDMGWNGIKNGELLHKMGELAFDILVAVDKNLPYQQNTNQLPLSIFILDVHRNVLPSLLPPPAETTRKMAITARKKGNRYQSGSILKISCTIWEDKDDVVVIELFHSKQDPEKLKELP